MKHRQRPKMAPKKKKNNKTGQRTIPQNKHNTQKKRSLSDQSACNAKFWTGPTGGIICALLFFGSFFSRFLL